LNSISKKTKPEPVSSLSREKHSRRRVVLEKGFQFVLALVTVAVVIITAYYSLILSSPTEVLIGPIKVEFSLKPSWHGKSVIIIPPAGSLEADTHSGPVEVNYDLKEIAISSLDDFTNPNSTARQELLNWQEPVKREVKLLIIKALIITATASGVIAGLWRRRWQWGLGGALLGMAVAVFVSGIAYATYDANAFREPRYVGGLAYAPELVAFSQETLANLNEYENRVPEIAESLYRTVNELHGLPATMLEENTIRVLHVSDMHSSVAGAILTKRVFDLYRVDFVIDTGDLTELGLPIEADYPDTYLPFLKPYIWIAGNHDTPTIIKKMQSIKNVIVLDNQFLMENGIKIGGFPDPASLSLSPAPLNDKEMAEEAGRIARIIKGENPRPFIVAVHDPRQAGRLAGVVPVVIDGHTHQEDITVKDGTVFLNAGTTGGGGLRSFNDNGESPTSLQVLYISKDSLKLEAVDTILIYGYQQEFSVRRRVFGPDEGVAGRMEAVMARPQNVSIGWQKLLLLTDC
jgi:predicted phosphodiesterase